MRKSHMTDGAQQWRSSWPERYVLQPIESKNIANDLISKASHISVPQLIGIHLLYEYPNIEAFGYCILIFIVLHKNMEQLQETI